MNGTQEVVPEIPLTPVPGGETNSIVAGGLRYAATTGYFLTALQAEPPRNAQGLNPVHLV